MKRFGALLAAAAMVVIAVVARGALDDDDADTTGRDETVAPPGLVCAADLADICADAGVQLARTEQAGTTADLLIAADDPEALDGSAWLVTSAWASLLTDERQRNRDETLFEVTGSVLASSGVVLAVWSDRAEQLAGRCGRPVDAALDWRCLAGQAGTDLTAGDRVRSASPNVDSAVGLVVAASQAAGLLGRDDFVSNDFEVGDFRSLAARLSAGQMADPLGAMRVQGPGQVTAAGTIVARATNLASTFGTIRPTVPEPTVRADVVLVVPIGTDVTDDQRAALVEALRSAGWDAPSAEPDRLPSGGVLAAVRTLWDQTR